MTTVFLQTFSGFRAGLIAVSIGLFAVGLIIVYTLEAFGGFEGMEQILEFVPESFRALLRAQGGFATSAQGFLAADYRHPIYLIGMSAFVIAAASGAVAREIERGSVLMLLAAPIARWKLLLSRMGALLAGVLVILAVSVLGTWTGIQLTGLSGEVDMTVFLRVQLNTLALALAIGGLTMLLSARSSDGGQTTGIAAGVFTVMYFLDFLAALWSRAEPFGPLSLFYYYDPQAISEFGGLPWRDLAVLFTVAVIGFGGALVVFQRRDIAR